jgi:hypothetical protein
MRNCRLWAAACAVTGTLALVPAAARGSAPATGPAGGSAVAPEVLRPDLYDPPLTKVLSLVQDRDPYESIYEPAGPPRVEEGVNKGGVNFDLRVSYLTDYVYRGLDKSERLAAVDGAGNPNPRIKLGHEDAPNLQFDGFLTLNLGRLPHPVAGVFANVFNDDPISRFQEIRPYFGFDWNL